MKTKLVYVLTCSPEATYIEQALLSIWSARYHNPSAYIVLIVDDKTETLLVDNRGEILKYISEKIVVPFDNESLTPMYRSRYIKTSVRDLISGDFLYIDCDTICCGSLSEVDDLGCEIGAVPDNNTLFQNDRYKAETCKLVSPIGCDISNEKYYFSSGVIYCKDTTKSRRLFELWHKEWLYGEQNKNIHIDQPSLAKADIAMNHFITPIDDKYNHVLYTEDVQIVHSTIIHITRRPKISFLFQSKVMDIVREQGLLSWVKELVLNVHTTYLPFDYALKYSSLRQRIGWISSIAYSAKIYGRYIDDGYSEWQLKVSIASMIKRLFSLCMYHIGAVLWIVWRYAIVRKNKNLYPNACLILK